MATWGSALVVGRDEMIMVLTVLVVGFVPGCPAWGALREVAALLDWREQRFGKK